MSPVLKCSCCSCTRGPHHLKTFVCVTNKLRVLVAGFCNAHGLAVCIIFILLENIKIRRVRGPLQFRHKWSTNVHEIWPVNASKEWMCFQLFYTTRFLSNPVFGITAQSPDEIFGLVRHFYIRRELQSL